MESDRLFCAIRRLVLHQNSICPYIQDLDQNLSAAKVCDFFNDLGSAAAACPNATTGAQCLQALSWRIS